MRRHVKAWAEKHHFDLVHFDTISLAPYRTFFPHTKGVLDHHNIESHMMLRRAVLERNWLKKFYYWQEGAKLRAYEKRVLGDFNLHITCSKLDSDRLRLIDSTVDITEIPNGVDIDFFRPGNTEKVPNSLVFAGGLRWYPNRKAMLFFANEIWPLLKRRIPTASMDVIGQSPPPPLLELAARDPSFRVHGFVDDVRDYLDRAAVYVCPITDGGGTKLKILDALAMGKPIVADPIACEGIDVIPGEHVIFAGTPEEYVDAIEKLLSEPAVRDRMSCANRQLILDHYAYTKIGENLSNLYQRL
jgi:glycosyltransferase involved in cell wall biosynthesis